MVRNYYWSFSVVVAYFALKDAFGFDFLRRLFLAGE